MANSAKARERVYYQTDSHWNYNGAVVGYDEIMRAVQARLRGTGRIGRLARVDLRVRVPAGLPRAALVARIVDELFEVVR